MLGSAVLAFAVVLGAFTFEGRFLARAVQSVAAQDPPTQADHAGDRDQERQAHPQPRRHPLTGQKEHESNYRQDDERLAPLGC